MRPLAALLLLALAPVRADELLTRLRTAPADDADAAVRAVLEANPDAAEVVARLAKPLPFAAAAAGWHEAEAVDEKGVRRPFEYYVPKSVAGGSKPVPLLVHLHGGVGRPEYFPNPGRRSTGGQWVESAEEAKFALAFPYGRDDCRWWTAAGAANVRAVVREMKRRVPIDDDAIVGTGFSDGASGAYYLALAEPDPFAAFLPLNGHFGVAASASGQNLYLRNLARTPLFIAQTQDDPLYPAASLLPHVRAAMDAGSRIHLVSYPRGGHTPAYFAEQRETMTRFIVDAARDPLPRRIDWWCADPRLGRVAWVELTSLGPSDADPAASEDTNVMSTPGRVRLGISVDAAFEGEGVRVDRVTADSLAATIGLEPGDVLTAADGRALRGMGDLRQALDAKDHGQEIAFTVLRAGESSEKKGRFPAFVSQPVYRREGPTAEFHLESEGNRVVVKCRHVRAFRLWLSPAMFADGEIALAVNGARVVPEVKAIPLEGVLRRYAREADAGRVFTRVATVPVP